MSPRTIHYKVTSSSQVHHGLITKLPNQHGSQTAFVAPQVRQTEQTEFGPARRRSKYISFYFPFLLNPLLALVSLFPIYR